MFRLSRAPERRINNATTLITKPIAPTINIGPVDTSAVVPILSTGLDHDVGGNGKHKCDREQ